MSANNSDIKRDLTGSRLFIKGNEIIDADANLKRIHSATVGTLHVRKGIFNNGDTTFNGNFEVNNIHGKGDLLIDKDANIVGTLDVDENIHTSGNVRADKDVVVQQDVVVGGNIYVVGSLFGNIAGGNILNQTIYNLKLHELHGMSPIEVFDNLNMKAPESPDTGVGKITWGNAIVLGDRYTTFGGTSSSIAIGKGASATASYCISMGNLVSTVSHYSIAIGSNIESSTIGKCVSIGNDIYSGFNSVSIGGEVSAERCGVAIGLLSTGSDYGVGIGYQAHAVSGIAIGRHSTSYNGSISMGTGSFSAEGSISIGHGSINNVAAYSVAIGDNCANKGLACISLGAMVSCEGKGNTWGYGDNAVGTFVQIKGVGSTAVGCKNYIYGNSSVAIGTGATVHGDQAIAIGSGSNFFFFDDSNSGATANGNFSLAIGALCYSEGNYCIAVGSNVHASSYSISIGYNSRCDDDSIAFGNSAFCNEGAVTIGNYSFCGEGGVSIGRSAHGSEDGVTIGYFTKTTGTGSVAIGSYSKCSGTGGFDNWGYDSVALGSYTSNRGNRSVAIGSSSYTIDSLKGTAVGWNARCKYVNNGLALGAEAEVSIDTEGFAITIPGNSLKDQSQDPTINGANSYAVIKINGQRYKMLLEKF